MTRALKNALLGQAITAAGTDEVVVINSNNNVNLNTSDPSAVFDIDHNVNINANLTAENGNFTVALRLNNVDVSVDGHPHIINDIAGLRSELDTLTGQAPATTAATNKLFMWQNFK